MFDIVSALWYNLTVDDKLCRRGQREMRITIKKILIAAVCVCLAFCVICPAVIAVVHGVVMGRYDYDKYSSDRYLTYADVKAEYPRRTLRFESGENTLCAYLYGEGNDKGLIVVSPGHTDANDIKLYEIRYFADAGYQVVCFDYTGCYTSEGKAFGGYTQAVHDLDALLGFIESSREFDGVPVYLFGHSLGGYAAAAVLGMGHDVRAVVSASGFDTAEEQWQYSISRYTGFFYPVIRPFNSLFVNMKYGEDKSLSAVEGINSTDAPVLVISAEEDSFYGGTSPIYRRRWEISNPNCTFMLMDEEGHNGHYDYFLTDDALEYQESAPDTNIDKELYMEHDADVMQMILDFFDDARSE